MSLKYTILLALLGLGLVACEDDPAGPDTTPDPFVFAMDSSSAYSRVDRMGMPAIATAVISSKDTYNQADPADDASGQFVDEITASVQSLHDALDDDLAALSLTPCATSDCVGQAAPFVVPDVIRFDATQPSGFPNGRGLADQVIDVTLALVLLDLETHAVDLFASLPLNPSANDLAFDASFPYLPAPHAP